MSTPNETPNETAETAATDREQAFARLSFMRDWAARVWVTAPETVRGAWEDCRAVDPEFPLQAVAPVRYGEHEFAVGAGVDADGDLTFLVCLVGAGRVLGIGLQVAWRNDPADEVEAGARLAFACQTVLAKAAQIAAAQRGWQSDPAIA